MPRLRPEILFREGRLIWDNWYTEMGEGACCAGEQCYNEASAVMPPVAARSAGGGSSLGRRPSQHLARD